METVDEISYRLYSCDYSDLSEFGKERVRKVAARDMSGDPELNSTKLENVVLRQQLKDCEQKIKSLLIENDELWLENEDLKIAAYDLKVKEGEEE